MMRILLIHQAFAGPNDPGGTRHFELAKNLVQNGHEIWILTSSISYITGKKKARSLSNEFPGIKIISIPNPPILHQGFFPRLIAFFYFMISSVWKAMKVPRPDCVIGTSPPIFQAVSALVIAKLKKSRFLLEIRDIWPDFAVAMGVLKNPVLIELSKQLEKLLYSKAECLVVNSPAYRGILRKRGVEKHKLFLIPNGADCQLFQPEGELPGIRDKFGLRDKFLITYAGALGPANNLVQVLEAAEQLKENSSIHFLLIGDGKSKNELQQLSRAKNLTNVTFTGAMGKHLMPGAIRESNVCLAVLANIPEFKTTYPNKVFDYMASGKPTLLAIDGVIRRVIEDSKGGIFIPPGDAKEMATAALKLFNSPELCRKMGDSARLHAKRHFDRNEQAQKFRQLLENFTGKSLPGQSEQPENLPVPYPKMTVYSLLFKPIFDRFLALILLILLFPLFVFLFCIIFLKMGSPVLFSQTRPGYQSRPFRIFKFRTMKNETDENGNSLPDDQRLTALGKWLRETSLDELPELWNILKGEMSFVGPRPLLMEYLPRYDNRQAQRHSVKPGLTGWSQVNGRNNVSWLQRFEDDIWYVENRSMKIDLQILTKTVKKVWKKEDINHKEHVSMPEFQNS